MRTVLRTILSFPLAPYDADARDYITRVERADGQALETGVRQAIDAFVRGCKSDGIWNAIKASCILAGARTLAGALVPLKGTAPTNFNFVSGDYNRKTGLVGDGSTKHLDSNRAGNADPDNNAHLCVYVTAVHSNGTSGALLGSGSDGSGNDESILESSSATNPNRYAFRFRNDGTLNTTAVSQQAGLVAASRGGSASYAVRYNQASGTITQASQGSNAFNYFVYAVNRGGSVVGRSSARLAFYSIGESLDLALLDTRVTTLINTLSSVIP